MKKIFLDTRENDKLCREKYFLSEELMMENAAAALEKYSLKLLKETDPVAIERPAVLVLCGKGNNGGDGYALARRLQGKKYSVTVCALEEASSSMCVLEADRAQLLGIKIISPYDLDEYLERVAIDLKLVADCIFGSGFHGSVPAQVSAVIERINSLDKDVKRISCDIPTPGFYADFTVAMGALKMPLFTDKVKDLAGKIFTADLGVAKSNFEFEGFIEPDAYLLEESDMILPFRKKQNVNKGSFGHAAVVQGEKFGAAEIASRAALSFGAGLVTLVNLENQKLINSNPEIMESASFPENTTAIIAGPGLGRKNKNTAEKIFSYILENKTSSVLDADIFYYSQINDFLHEAVNKKIDLVLTPHPKEFSVLLKNTNLGDFTVGEVIEKREELIKAFGKEFPGVVILLKGANVFIEKNQNGKDRLFVNTLGTSALSKAGSGDVLAGIIGAFLAQKKDALESACSASIIHAMGAKKMEPDFALTPLKLISLSLDAAASVLA